LSDCCTTLGPAARHRAKILHVVQVEARHASLVRLMRNKPVAPRAFDKRSEIEMACVLKAVKPFITTG